MIRLWDRFLERVATAIDAPALDGPPPWGDDEEIEREARKLQIDWQPVGRICLAIVVVSLLTIGVGFAYWR